VIDNKEFLQNDEHLTAIKNTNTRKTITSSINIS
jgi:hypothetical protein